MDRALEGTERTALYLHSVVRRSPQVEGPCGSVQRVDDTALDGVCDRAPEAVERVDRRVEGPNGRVQEGDDRPLQGVPDRDLEGAARKSLDLISVFHPSSAALWRQQRKQTMESLTVETCFLCKPEIFIL